MILLGFSLVLLQAICIHVYQSDNGFSARFQNTIASSAFTWYITAQNTFLTFWHLFHVRGIKFSSQVSGRKIYDVNLVLALLRRKIYQRLFYGEKSIIVQCTLKVVLKSSNISRRHLYDVIIFSMTRYVVIITSTWNYDVNEEVRVTR